jgi:hypothetical protein
MGVARLSSLLFVSLVGSPIANFNPSPHVEKFLVVNHHVVHDNKSRKGSQKVDVRYDHRSTPNFQIGLVLC